MQMNTMIIFET